jgi:hypothetical protein
MISSSIELLDLWRRPSLPKPAERFIFQRYKDLIAEVDGQESSNSENAIIIASSLQNGWQKPEDITLALGMYIADEAVNTIEKAKSSACITSDPEDIQRKKRLIEVVDRGNRFNWLVSRRPKLRNQIFLLQDGDRYCANAVCSATADSLSHYMNNFQSIKFFLRPR